MEGSRSCRNGGSGNNRTLPGALPVVVYRGLRSLWSLTHGYENHTLRAVFRGLVPMDYILPPLTRFCMVILSTVGSANAHPRL